MKKLLFITLLAFSFSKGFSAYLVNVPQTLKQPDGTVLHCFASGDEFYNWLHDSLGYTIVENAQGYYVYALPAADGQIAPSNQIVGIADPAALGLPVRVSVSNEIIRAKRAEFEAELGKSNLQKANGANNKGHINNIVVFIRFSDESNYVTPFGFSTMESMFNDSTSLSSNSMYNFYRLSSYGQLYITSHFYPAPSGNTILSYQDNYPRSYYKVKSTSNPNGYSSGEETSRKEAMLVRAINYIKNSVPTGLDIDYDDDGNVDNVAFLVSGSPEGWSELLWPHRSWLYSNATINGKKVSNYNFLLANTNYGNTWAGVITHEMFHTLGAPDLYHYATNPVDAIGNWDLMGSTNYGRAQGLGAHMKCKYGMWIPQLPAVVTPGTYTLYPVNDSTMIFDEQKPIGYQINIPGNTNEYLVLEYRKTNACTFEQNLSGSGILIYRINKTRNGNAYADGTNSYDEVYVFRPNGTKTVNGTIANAHFSSGVGRTAFDPGTNPYPFFCNGTAMTGFSITNITAAGDSIQFTYNTKWDALSTSKSQIAFDYQSGNADGFTVSSNVSWIIKGVDTSWLTINRLSGDSGTTTIQLSTRSQNDLRVTKICTLLIQYGDPLKEKQVLVSQGIQEITHCQAVNNSIAGDSLSGYNFQRHGITAVSEFFAAAKNTQVIDTVAFYFGNINIVDSLDNNIKIEIYRSNASDRPGNTLLSQTVSAKDLKPNAWNTIELQKPIIATTGLTVGYSFARTDTNFLRINIYKNAKLRTSTCYGTLFVRQGSWKKPSEVTFTDVTNYSLAMRLFTCPPSPATDTLLVSTTKLNLPYDSNAKISFNITSNTSWRILNIPAGYSASQTSGTGNAVITITTLSKHREAKKTYTFYVHSGSILHEMSIDRATYILFSNKKELVLNYQGTDSADVLINAIGTNWVAQTNCSWLKIPNNTGNAGSQRLVVYPTGANTTAAEFKGCVDIVSATLGESICIVVQQNSAFTGIQPPQDASALSIYPNPATSQLSINNGNTPIQTIIVYNVIGKEILKISDVNTPYTELNIADLYTGLYFIKVCTATSVQVRKFVKN
jgi:M6 family metalloprotease-like protein